MLDPDLITPDKAQERSENPYHPSDPRWKEWARIFTRYEYERARRTGFNHSRVDAQIERMEAVKAATPQRTEAQIKADEVMAQVESYHRWREAEQRRREFEEYKAALLAYAEEVTIAFQASLEAVSTIFGMTIDEVTKAFDNIAQALRYQPKERLPNIDRGWIPDDWYFVDTLDSLVWDIRSRIAAMTWLQFDSI